MQCTKCGVTTADNWIKHKVSNIVEQKTGTLHTIKPVSYTHLTLPTNREV